MIESEYHRERKLRFPIGQPLHCEQIQKTNRTACPSFCAASNGLEPAKVNQVSEMPEAPENIPENVEIIETSTPFKSQKLINNTINSINTTSSITTTTKLLPIERKSESIESFTTLSDTLNHTTSIEHTTAKDKIDNNNSSQGSSQIDDNNNINKMAIQAEEPVEVRESLSNTQNTPAPVVQSNYSEKVEPIPNERIDDVQKKQLDINAEIKQQQQQEIEPFSDAHSGSIKENDIKPTFQKNENKCEKSCDDDGDAPKTSNGNLEPLAPIASSQTTTSTPSAYGIPLEATNPACIFISVQIRTESFNMTIGSDEICRNFNITYNIPLSKYMKENRFEIVFM